MKEDTVAQKPSQIGTGVKKTVPAADADEENRQPTSGAQPPVEERAAKMSAREEVAAGLPAIQQTVRFAWREMGLGRATKTLLAVNQKNGFICQSCAWPSPDEERNVAEFCENGAKAVADEATTQRLTNVLVPINSVAERSNTPTSKFVVISIAPAPDAEKASRQILAGGQS